MKLSLSAVSRLPPHTHPPPSSLTRTAATPRRYPSTLRLRAWRAHIDDMTPRFGAWFVVAIFCNLAALFFPWSARSRPVTTPAYRCPGAISKRGRGGYAQWGASHVSTPLRQLIQANRQSSPWLSPLVLTLVRNVPRPAASPTAHMSQNIGVNASRGLLGGCSALGLSSSPPPSR